MRLEEPVAAPGDVPGDPAYPGDLDLDIERLGVGRHILDSHRAVLVELGRNRSDRSVDLELPRPDPPHVLESAHQPDRSVAAHAEPRGVVEEDDSGFRLWRHRWCQQRPDDGVVPSRLADDGLAKVIRGLLERLDPSGHRVALGLWPTGDHHAGRLTTGV
jgi:hypothetical protein